VRIEAGRHSGEAIPGARFVALDGKDHCSGPANRVPPWNRYAIS
jgi:hypothetical protein